MKTAFGVDVSTTNRESGTSLPKTFPSSSIIPIKYTSTALTLLP